MPVVRTVIVVSTKEPWSLGWCVVLCVYMFRVGREEVPHLLVSFDTGLFLYLNIFEVVSRSCSWVLASVIIIQTGPLQSEVCTVTVVCGWVSCAELDGLGAYLCSFPAGMSLASSWPANPPT